MLIDASQGAGNPVIEFAFPLYSDCDAVKKEQASFLPPGGKKLVHPLQPILRSLYRIDPKECQSITSSCYS